MSAFIGTTPVFHLGAPDEPDPSGQAALLLAESTLHILVEAGVLSSAQAIDAIQTAREVKGELAEETGESAGTRRESLRLLERIEHSFVSLTRV